MLRTVDRYVVREIVAPFCLALVVFTFLLQIAPLGDIAERLIAKGVSAGTVAAVMVTLIPQALAITIPMAFLLGLLVAFGRLSGDRECVALQACGVSTYRLLRPAFALGVLAWAATSWVMIWAVPWGNQTFREITYSVLQARAEGEVKPRVFFDDFPNFVLYARDVVPNQPGWTDVFVAETGRGDQPVIYVANHGRLVLDRSKRTVELVLEKGTRHVVTPDETGQVTEKYEMTQFDTLVISLDPESVFPRSGPQKGDQERTIAELRAHIASLERQGISTHNAVMAIQKKFSIPVACLVFAVMGLALGVSSSRTGKLASFVLGLMVIFAYYVVMYTSESLAKAALLPAWLAPWTPNIVLGVTALVLLVYRNRSTGGFPRLVLPFRRFVRPAGATQPSPAAARSGQPALVVVRVPRFGVPRPGILDRYVSKLFARLFVLTAVSLLGIFYIATFIDLSDKLFKGTATVRMLAEYFWFSTPQFAYYVVPLGVLIGGLVTIGALTRNSELVVMKACGISLYRVAAPLLVCAVLASAVLFGLGEQVLPDANRRANEVGQVMRHGPTRTLDVFNRRWVVGKNGEIYHYTYFDPRQLAMDRLSIYEFRQKPWTLARRTFVTRAVAGRGAAGAKADVEVPWHASLGWVREFGPGGASRSWAPFAKRDLLMEPPDYFGRERPAAEQMTYGELAHHIGELKAAGFNVVPLAVQLQRKLSFPVVTVVMILIAVPFAVLTGRRGALYGVGVGIVLALVYWVMGNVFGAIGSAGLLAPALAAWAPNTLFGAAAAYLLFTVHT
jgi:LPS export ABC transporter permease LptF/LPS export ABC transporter permease LptG